MTHVPQTVAKKMSCLQKDIRLPKEFRLDTSVSQPVFNVLREDADVLHSALPSIGTSLALSCNSSFPKAT